MIDIICATIYKIHTLRYKLLKDPSIIDPHNMEEEMINLILSDYRGTLKKRKKESSLKFLLRVFGDKELPLSIKNLFFFTDWNEYDIFGGDKFQKLANDFEMTFEKTDKVKIITFVLSEYCALLTNNFYKKQGYVWKQKILKN